MGINGAYLAISFYEWGMIDALSLSKLNGLLVEAIHQQGKILSGDSHRHIIEVENGGSIVRPKHIPVPKIAVNT